MQVGWNLSLLETSSIKNSGWNLSLAETSSDETYYLKNLGETYYLKKIYNLAETVFIKNNFAETRL